MDNARSRFRLPIQRRGFLTLGNRTILCEVWDLTEQGVQFTADHPVSVGETTRIEMQLDGESLVHGELLIIHARDGRYGGRLTRMSPEDRRALAQYVERVLSRCFATTP